MFTAIPDRTEARRWTADFRFTTRALRLHATDQPDVVIEPGKELSLVPPTDSGDHIIKTDPRDRLLLQWGRCPLALRRHPIGNPETIDELLSQLSV